MTIKGIMKKSILFIVFSLLLSACVGIGDGPTKLIKNDPRIENLQGIAIFADVTLLNDNMVGEDFWSIGSSRTAAEYMIEYAKQFFTENDLKVVYADAPSIGIFKNKEEPLKFLSEEGGQLEEKSPPLFLKSFLISDHNYQNALTTLYSSTLEASDHKSKLPSDSYSLTPDAIQALTVVSKNISANAVLLLVGNGTIVSGAKSLTQSLVTGIATGILTMGMLSYSQWDVSVLDTYALLVDTTSGEILWSKSIRLKGGDFTNEDYYPNWSAHILGQLMSKASKNYVGCFKDGGNPYGTSGRDMSAYSEGARDMTIEKCLTICESKGYAFAGLQFRKHCFCDNSYGSKGPADNCNMYCSGNISQTCGGSWANSVYKTN